MEDFFLLKPGSKNTSKVYNYHLPITCCLCWVDWMIMPMNSKKRQYLQTLPISIFLELRVVMFGDHSVSIDDLIGILWEEVFPSAQLRLCWLTGRDPTYNLCAAKCWFHAQTSTPCSALTLPSVNTAQSFKMLTHHTAKLQERGRCLLLIFDICQGGVSRLCGLQFMAL